jgi:hypothetical protein
MKKLNKRLLKPSLALLALAFLFLPSSAKAQYLGINGRIIYGGIGSTSGLATIKPDGTNIHVHGTMQNVSSRRFAVYSPNGTQFAWSEVVGDQSDIYTGTVASSVTGTARTSDASTNDINPYYSEDGTKIIFTRQTIANGNKEIWIMNSDGTNQIQLTNQLDSGNVDMAVFDPTDPDKLYVTTESGTTPGIYSISASTPNQTTGTLILDPTVGSSPLFLDISPDGSTLIYVILNSSSAKEQIRKVSNTGTGDAAISQDNTQNYTTAVYSPDGTKIASEKCNDCVSGEKIVIMSSSDGSDETSILSSTLENDVILTSVSYWGSNQDTYSDQGNPGGSDTPGAPNTTTTNYLSKNYFPIVIASLATLGFITLLGIYLRKEFYGRKR